MTMLAMFTTAVELSGPQRLFMMFPLCLSVAVVYKSTRCASLNQMPVAALVLWITVVLSMLGVGVGLYLLFTLMV